MTSVSVIVPAHNAERTVEACLFSVIQQSHYDLELIVVDDDSTDNTRHIVAGVTDSRVKLLSVSCHSASGARNAGLRIASGEYVQFLDADDILAPNKLEVQLQRLRQESRSAVANCPWGHFRKEIADAKLESQRIDRDMKPLNWLLESWNGGGMAQTACWLTPRGLIDLAGGWNEDLRRNPNDDGEFFCRVLLKSNAVVFTTGTCVYYRLPVAGCVSRVESEEQAGSLLRSYIECEKYVRSIEDSPRTRGAIAQNYYRYIYQYHERFACLCDQARDQLRSIGWPPCMSVGPLGFRLFTQIVGFDNAMRIREIRRWLPSLR
jgi:glycosyltransferase involved in cell wall biosynthesis